MSVHTHAHVSWLDKMKCKRGKEKTNLNKLTANWGEQREGENKINLRFANNY